jgi:prepilin signal peptidase PulO-like enzyme (type II secretory pathway)
MALFFIFIFGLIVGSFLNVVIFRLHSGKSFLIGRSECPHCHHSLSAWDLIPLASFVFLGGKCRYCKTKISYQYPMVELTTAVVFVLFFVNNQWSIINGQLWFQIIFACFLIVVAVYDFKHYLILDKVVFPALGLAIIWSLISGNFIAGLVSAIVIAGFFGLQYLVSRGQWMGLGDVKLGLFLGFLAPWPQSLVLLMLAYFSGAVVGLVLVAINRKHLSSQLPFGVFLSFSAIIVMLFGQPIMNWYLRLIGLQ